MKTVEFLGTDVPADGFWDCTVAPGAPQFDAEELRPASLRSLTAFTLVSPMTDGTDTVLLFVVVVGLSVVVGAGPLDTVSVTVDPLLALAPAGGLVLMTLPAATLSDDCVFVVVLNPAWPRTLPASDASCPTTLGMAAWPVPLETVRATDEPLAAVVPGLGFWSSTSFCCLSLCWARVVTTKPSCSRSALADVNSL